MRNQRVDRETRFVYQPRDTPVSPREIEDPTAELVAGTPPPRTLVAYQPYLPDEGLTEAVNLALTLRRPLLLQGDPGCGKTSLAAAVAFELGWPLETCYIKSTSRARDLLYTYDVVGRLYDAQLGLDGPRDPRVPEEPRFRNPSNYVRLEPFGRAIVRAGLGRPSVVLIDEIDKADLDFPNDLLRELDELTFEIPEVPDTIHAAGDDIRTHPLIIITNNEEKALPSAFLRRCIFHLVKAPRELGQLRAILEAHEAGSPALVAEATEIFLKLVKNDSLMKKPGLSELLDWVRYHSVRDTRPDDLRHLPAMGALLKLPHDVERTQRDLEQ